MKAKYHIIWICSIITFDIISAQFATSMFPWRRNLPQQGNWPGRPGQRWQGGGLNQFALGQSARENGLLNQIGVLRRQLDQVQSREIGTAQTTGNVIDDLRGLWNRFSGGFRPEQLQPPSQEVQPFPFNPTDQNNVVVLEPPPGTGDVSGTDNISPEIPGPDRVRPDISTSGRDELLPRPPRGNRREFSSSGRDVLRPRPPGGNRREFSSSGRDVLRPRPPGGNRREFSSSGRDVLRPRPPGGNRREFSGSGRDTLRPRGNRREFLPRPTGVSRENSNRRRLFPGFDQERSPISPPDVRPPITLPDVRPPIPSPDVGPVIPSPDVIPSIKSPDIGPLIPSPDVGPPIPSPGGNRDYNQGRPDFSVNPGGPDFSLPVPVSRPIDPNDVQVVPDVGIADPAVIIDESAGIIPVVPGDPRIDPFPGDPHIDPFPGDPHVDPFPGDPHIDPFPGDPNIDSFPGDPPIIPVDPSLIGDGIGPVPILPDTSTAPKDELVNALARERAEARARERENRRLRRKLRRQRRKRLRELGINPGPGFRGPGFHGKDVHPGPGFHGKDVLPGPGFPGKDFVNVKPVVPTTPKPKPPPPPPPKKKNPVNTLANIGIGLTLLKMGSILFG